MKLADRENRWTRRLEPRVVLLKEISGVKGKRQRQTAGLTRVQGEKKDGKSVMCVEANKGGEQLGLFLFH